MDEEELARLVVRLIGDTDSYQKMFDEAAKKAGEMERASRKLGAAEKATAEAIERGAEVTRQVENATDRYNREIKELDNLLTQGAISQKTFNRAASQAKKQFREAGNSASQYGRQIKAIGQAGMFRITAPILGIGAASVFAGTQIQSAFGGVRKTVDATEDQLQGLRNEFESFITEGNAPFDITELFGAAETAGQLGIDFENIPGFAKVVKNLELATNLGNQAGESLARISNITGLPQTQFENLGSTIVALGNTTATTEQDIVDMTLRLAGAGKQIGLTVPQTTALAASLSSMGIEAEAGGTAFSTLFTNLAKHVATGSDELQAFASAAGKSVEEFSDMFRRDAAGAVMELLRGLKSMRGEDALLAMEDMGIEGARLTDALLRSSSAVDLMSDAMKTADQAFEENTALTKEAEQRYGSFAGILKSTKAQLQLLGGEIFKTLEPALRSGIDILKSLIQFFKDADSSTQTWIIAIGAIAASIPPAVVAIGSLVFFSGQAVVGFKTLLDTTKRLSAFSGIKTWFRSLRSDVSSIPSKAATEKFDLIRRGSTNLASSIKTSGASISSSYSGVVSTTQNMVKSTTASLSSLSSSAVSTSSSITTASTNIQSSLTGIGSTSMTVSNQVVASSANMVMSLKALETQALITTSSMQAMASTRVNQMALPAPAQQFQAGPTPVAGFLGSNTGSSTGGFGATGDVIDVTATKVQRLTNQTTEATKSFSRFTKPLDSVKNGLSSIGSRLKPVVSGIGKAASGLSGIGAIAGSMAAASLPFLNEFGSVVAAIGTHMAITKIASVGLTASFIAMKAGLIGIITTATAAVAPFLPLIAAIVAVGAAFVMIIGQGDTFKEKLFSAFSQLTNIVSTFFDALNNVKDVISGISVGVFREMKSVLSNVKEATVDLFSSWANNSTIITSVKGISSILVSKLSPALDSVTNKIREFYGISDEDTGLIEGIKQTLAAVSEFNNELERSKKLEGEISTTLSSSFQNEISDIGSIVNTGDQEDALKDLEQRTINNVQGIGNSVIRQQNKIQAMKDDAGIIGSIFGNKLIEDEEERLNSLEARSKAFRDQLKEVRRLQEEGIKPSDIKAPKAPTKQITESQKLSEEVDVSLVQKFEQQLSNIGITERTQKIIDLEVRADDLERAGEDVTALRDQIETLRNLDVAIDVKIRDQEIEDTITKRVEELQTAISSVGLEGAELELFNLENLGATEEQLSRVKHLLDELKEKTELESRKKEAENLTDKYLPPQDKFEERKKHLEGLLDEGLIDQNTFDAALDEAGSKLDSLKDKTDQDYTVDLGVKGIDAVEIGSAEALDRVNQFIQGRATKDISKQLPAPPDVVNKSTGIVAEVKNPASQTPNVVSEALSGLQTLFTGLIPQIPQALTKIEPTPSERSDTAGSNQTASSDPSNREVLNRIAVAAERLVVITEGRPIIELEPADFTS